MFNRANYYNHLYSVDISIYPLDVDIVPVPSPLNVQENDELFPIDPTSGQLVDLLSQILQTDNPLLRDSLMSKLETVSPSSSSLSGVDDDIKIQLLKPRSCQSLSEMASFADYVSSALEQLNVPEHDSEHEPEPKLDSEPNLVSEPSV